MEKGVEIHSTAIVEKGAQLGKSVQVGPYCLVGKDVVLEDGVCVQSHVVLRGHTHIGEDSQLFPFCVIGGEPQHKGYQDEPTKTIVGKKSVLREGVTIHRGTAFGNHQTVIGEQAYLMAYSHVAHDCILGNHVTLANAVLLAGHVILEDYVTVGGDSAISQFCRVGRYCYVGGGSILRQDLLPFTTGKGNVFLVQGINVVGLQRLGYSKETIRTLRELFKIFYRQNLTVEQAIEKMSAAFGDSDEVKVYTDFITQSKMGFVR